MDALFGIDLILFIKAAGYVGIFAIIFAESGVLIGFFLPGDSLLFTAGFLASQGFLEIRMLMIITFFGAILGDSMGYMLGKKFGPRIFKSKSSFVFHEDHITRARLFYEKHGPKTIVLARFMPIVRTVAPILAGVGSMSYPIFFSFNIIGGALWAIGLTSLGYYLGSVIPNIDHYLLPIIIAIILFSISPTIIHIARNKEDRAHIADAIKKLWKNSKN